MGADNHNMSNRCLYLRFPPLHAQLRWAEELSIWGRSGNFAIPGKGPRGDKQELKLSWVAEGAAKHWPFS